jgi:hypothetical protein
MSSAHKAIQELQQVTNAIVERLAVASFEELLEFVNQRELLIEQMNMSQWTDEMKALYKRPINHILSYDPLIVQQMQRIKDGALQGIERLNSAKKQRNAYDAEYISDGVYFDRKK